MKHMLLEVLKWLSIEIQIFQVKVSGHSDI